MSFFQQRVRNLFDLSRLPIIENSFATQFTSRNWVSLEHYFDYFIDDGNFVGPNYGYSDDAGHRQSYRIVTGYDGMPEYEIVPRVAGPGSIDRIWFAYQQHQSINNPKDMSQVDEWANWGNLGAMGNIRFYFDDASRPQIDFSIKDLFVGKAPFVAPLTAFYASADGGNIDYVPIPFQQSVRVTTTGRPRLMQIEVKRFLPIPAPSTPTITNSPTSASATASASPTLAAPALASTRRHARDVTQGTQIGPTLETPATTTLAPTPMAVPPATMASGSTLTLASSTSNPTSGRGPTSTDSLPVQSFLLNVTPEDQSTLEQGAQAWQSCTPNLPVDQNTYQLSIPHNTSGEVDFREPATISSLTVRVPRGLEDSVWMQIFWDGEPQPSMSASLRGMFGTAERFLPYQALPMGTLSVGQEYIFYDRFPMPYQSARIVFINNRAETLPVTLQVVITPTLPGTETARLHAYYGTRRLEAREDNSDNYTIIDVNGRGKYLGLILSAWDEDRRALNGPLDPNWRFPYLESNMNVWIDGRLALPGTGIEDDFNASYYYVFYGYPGYKTTYCLAGITLMDHNSPTEPSSQYRFYLNDAPEFRSHLYVEAEHGNKGNNLTITYSSTAFWYQLK